MNASGRARLYWVQRLYPWALGATASLVMVVVLRHHDKAPLTNLKELLSATLSIDAIVVGFVATAKTMVASLDGKRPVENAKRRGAWPMIVGYTAAAVNVSMVGMAFSTTLLLVAPAPKAWTYQLLVAAWFGVLVATGGAYHRVALMMGEMLKGLHAPPDPATPKPPAEPREQNPEA